MVTDGAGREAGARGSTGHESVEGDHRRIRDWAQFHPTAPHPFLQAPIWGNPAHPFTIVANTVWLVFFGWGLALMHLAAAGVQALTIIGIPTALTNVQLALLAL